MLPARAPEREAARVLRELEGWIAPRLAALDARRAQVAEQAGGGLPYLGRTLEVVPEPGRRRVHRAGDRIAVPADPELRGRALESWYRARARDEARPRLDLAATALGVDVLRLRITDTRSRWGSCSTSGTISLSWRLLLAPPECLDYVVWHEACHLIHAHHGASFWRLLESHRPHWREPAGWLRQNGADLHLWLADGLTPAAAAATPACDPSSA